MSAKFITIDSAKLRQIIRSIPVVYPKKLAFLSDVPIEQTYVIRQLLTGPVLTTAAVPFLAFSSEKDGRKFLMLLVTSDSLSRPIDYTASELLKEMVRTVERQRESSPIGDAARELPTELGRPPRRVGWWGRLLAEFGAGKKQEEQIQEMQKRGEIDSKLAGAMSKLHFPVLHDDDIFVAFPEDDFDDDSGRSFEKALKLSGIKRVCSRIQPLRCGLPVSFTNKLFTVFRSQTNAA